jgi:hypothetical protein
VTRSRRPLALLAGLLALGALVVGAWSAAQFRSATLGRPWFAAPTQLAVGADGALYVGIGASEVQVYAKDGAPQRAWYTARAQPFRLRPVAGDASVELVYADDRVEPVGVDGQAAAARSEPGAWEALGPPTLEATTPDRARVALRGEGLVRLDDAGTHLLVPLPPTPLAWFGVRPLLPITLTLLGALLLLVCTVTFARRETSPA